MLGPWPIAWAAMKTIVLGVYAVAFLLQISGAILVIQDALASRRDMRQLKLDLADAEAAADDHRRKISGQYRRLSRPPPRSRRGRVRR